MQRFSPWLLGILVLLCLALLTALFVLLNLRTPEEQAGSPLLGQAAATGRHFDEDLGSLRALVPEAGGIVPTPIVVAAVSHGEGYRDVEWLKAQNAAAYTLQVLGSRSEAAVKRFIEAQADASQFSYFESREGDEPWFVVVYGNFSTREQALGVADGLDFGTETQPFPKRFGVYVDALALAARPPAVESPPVLPAEPEPEAAVSAPVD